jgi:peptidyl-prolyl cis-trans isomerase A (cyclophilin A)
MKTYKSLFILGLLSIIFSSCFQATSSPADDELVALKKFITTNYPDIEANASGLYFIPQKTGYGNQPTAGDTLIMNYVGTLPNSNNTEFDNTYTAGTPFTYVVGGKIGLIAGFSEGIMLMREGQTAIFVMPSSLAYGAKQNGLIPPYSSLLFQVELIAIKH